MILSRCVQGRVWKNLKINDKDHAICFTKENESWKVFLTNLIEIWAETLTDETMFHKCKTMNPLLNLEAFDWKQLLLDMLNNIPQYVHTNVLDVTVYRIELRKGDLKLKFQLNLLKETPQRLWESVTMPLCLASMELARRHKILLNLVKQKDEEIAEYKAEGAELIRKYIATKPFSEELFHIDAAGSDATDFPNTFQFALHFYNEMNLLKSHGKLESKDSKVSSDSTSATNGPKTDGKVLSDSSRNESEQKLNQDELDNEQECLKVEECKAGPSSSNAPILRISSTSHMIHKLKKNKKTLNDFIM